MKYILKTAVVALVTAGKAGVNGATVLQPNNVQIVSFASDAPDGFSFVTWVDLDPGAVIRFTDKGWTCSGFQSTGETELRFTALTEISAGSVFKYEDGTSQDEWWLSGSFSLGRSGDQIIVYQGRLTNPTLIFAFDTTDGWEDCDDVGANAKKSALPTGLVDGVSAVSFAHSDSFWYKPWYAKSATLATLKEWMVNRNRFKTTSSSAIRKNDYEVPSGFTILSGQRGTNGYTEYIPGTAACIILSGQDGDLYPPSIDDRNDGCWEGLVCDWSKTCSPQDSTNCKAKTGNDENTQDMARRANDYFEDETGERCHLIVNRLARVKLDPNREVEPAAQFDQAAIIAYEEFHDFATAARANITNNPTCGAGILIDFHGHVHPEARIEMGYKLSASLLRDDDAFVDTLAYTSSIKNMSTHSGARFSSVVRGSFSMGALFELATTLNASGYLSVPSQSVYAPGGGEEYSQGGYNIETHGSQTSGSIDGVQIAFPMYLRTQEFGMQDDMLKAFGVVVLPKMLENYYPYMCDPLAAPTTSTTTATTTTTTGARI